MKPQFPYNEIITNDEVADHVGLQLGMELGLLRDDEHSDRWETPWGTKTNIGLARTILHVMETSVEDFKPKSLFPQTPNDCMDLWNQPKKRFDETLATFTNEELQKYATFFDLRLGNKTPDDVILKQILILLHDNYLGLIGKQ